MRPWPTAQSRCRAAEPPPPPQLRSLSADRSHRATRNSQATGRSSAIGSVGGWPRAPLAADWPSVSAGPGPAAEIHLSWISESVLQLMHTPAAVHHHYDPSHLTVTADQTPGPGPSVGRSLRRRPLPKFWAPNIIAPSPPAKVARLTKHIMPVHTPQLEAGGCLAGHPQSESAGASLRVLFLKCNFKLKLFRPWLRIVLGILIRSSAGAAPRTRSDSYARQISVTQAADKGRPRGHY